MYDVAFSPDGTTLATCSTDKLGKLWNVADGAEKGKLEGHGDAVWAITYSKDGSKLATCGADKFVKVFEVPTGKFLKSALREQLKDLRLS